MTSIADFHLHSIHSDGRKTPADLAALAHRNGVRYLALTDHDTVAGLGEMRAALAAYPEITLIPGVELSVEMGGAEVHLLGYWFDERNPAFLAQLERFREGRLGRGQQMVAKLRALGMAVEWDRVREIAGDASVGRPHVALALLEKGYVGSVNEAFDRYLANGGPAYVAREKLTPEDAIAMLHAAGGIAVVAHPQYIGARETLDDAARRDGYLERLRDAGAIGMEVYYKGNSPELIAELKEAADRFGLTPFGGSDYHALSRDDEREPGMIPLPDAAVPAMLALGEGRPGWSEQAADGSRQSGEGPRHDGP
jgi:predicted metal-dependent phosphoesterase TrpH